MCSISSLFQHRSDIKRRAAGLDSIGRASGAYYTVASQVACWFAPSTAKELNESISGEMLLYTGYFNVDSGLLASDQIVWGTRIFDVVTVRNYYDRYLTSELREVRS